MTEPDRSASAESDCATPGLGQSPQCSTRQHDGVNHRVGAGRGVISPCTFYSFYAINFFDLFGSLLLATHCVPRRNPHRY